MSYDVNAVRADFPGLSREKKGRPVAFLDNPAGTQVPRMVVERMAAAMYGKNSNLGGYYDTSIEASQMVADAHAAAATLVNARHREEVFFGQNMTTLTFAMSRSIGSLLQQGDEIVLTRMDHDANVAPWLMLADDLGLTVRWLDFSPETFEFDLDDLRALMTERTRLVAACYASNITGTINDIAGISAIAHEAGALVYVDAVQYAPHGLIDVQKLDCDFLVCSAYKFFGPHYGVFWGRREVLDRLKPYKVRAASNDLPWRFTTGTTNREALAGVHAAIDYIAALSRFAGPDQAGGDLRSRLAAGFGVMKAHDDILTGRLIDGLGSLNRVRILGIRDPKAMDRRVSTVSFYVEDAQSADIAPAMAAEGIQLWSGHNYGLEANRLLGILEKGSGVRVGPVHYNTPSDVDRVVDVLGGWVSAN